MENTKKYDSYFQEDIQKPNDEPKKKEAKKEYKIPFSKPRSIQKEKQYEEPPANTKNIIKDINDMKTLSLEELNQLPYSRNELKPWNSSNKNIENFDSLDQLYETYGNDLEYEVVDLQDLKNFMGEEFDDNMIIPSEDQIESLEKEVQADPQNFNTLMKLIYAYKDTNKKDKLKQTREHTASLFPLSEEMWKDWIKDEMAEIKPDDITKKYEFIDIMFKRAIRDFYCKHFLINHYY